MGVESKAKMLLANGQVTIINISRNSILARVQGSEPEPYRTTVYKDGKWNCECKYFQKGIAEDTPRIWECSHALAVKLSPVYKEWIIGLFKHLVDLNGEKNPDHSMQSL